MRCWHLQPWRGYSELVLWNPRWQYWIIVFLQSGLSSGIPQGSILLLLLLNRYRRLLGNTGCWVFPHSTGWETSVASSHPIFPVMQVFYLYLNEIRWEEFGRHSTQKTWLSVYMVRARRIGTSEDLYCSDPPNRGYACLIYICKLRILLDCQLHLLFK